VTVPNSGQGHSALPDRTKGPTRWVAYIVSMSDLEREYSPSSRVGGDAGPFVADYVARSAAAAALLGGTVTTLPGGTLLAAAGPGAPLLVFVHGGYWQALSAATSLYPAPAALALGWSYAAVEYTIAPAGTVAGMVRECRDALAVLAGVVRPAGVVLVGHSAGAHLAAMVSLAAGSPLPVDRTVLLSGVFDLRPLLQTTVNDALGLDDSSAMALSPQLLPVAAHHEVVVAWGDNETDAFKLQSRAYAKHLELSGSPVLSLGCSGRHHFDIVDDVVDPSTTLGQLALGDS